MTLPQRNWAEARGRLREAIGALGYPQEFADLLAGQLRSPGAMDRMCAWLRQAQPRSMETIIDEMLAICAEIDAWREKKESREAQAGYSAWLNSDARRRNLEED